MDTTQTPAVLVIDDDASTRDALRMLLEDAGYPVLEAADGVQALERLRARQERLVAIVDLLMPRMEDFQLLRMIAGDEPLATRHAYIAVTAARPPSESSTALDLAGLLAQLQAPLLPKPFDIDRFLAAVAAAAERIGATHSGDV